MDLIKKLCIKLANMTFIVSGCTFDKPLEPENRFAMHGSMNVKDNAVVRNATTWDSTKYECSLCGDRHHWTMKRILKTAVNNSLQTIVCILTREMYFLCSHALIPATAQQISIRVCIYELTFHVKFVSFWVLSVQNYPYFIRSSNLFAVILVTTAHKTKNCYLAQNLENTYKLL